MSDYLTEVVDVDTEQPVEDAPQQEENVDSSTNEAEETQVETPEPTNVDEAEESSEPEAQAEEPQENESKLVELPDGRKLTPEEARNEYLKLQSEFTRKSQKLATYEKGKNITNQNQDEEEEFVPETIDDLYAHFKEREQKERQLEEQRRQEAEEQIKGEVTSQLEELKKENPNLNEEQLFAHAIKYGFKDLKMAHMNRKEMFNMLEKTKKETVNNLKKRKSDPVSGNQSAGNIVDGDEYDPSVRHVSAVDYLNSLNN